MSATDSESKTKADVYRERNLLAVALLYERAGRPAGRVRNRRGPLGWWPDRDTVNGDEWAVVWCDLGALNPATTDRRQVGWHVPVEIVPQWVPRADPEYAADPYSTTEKNARLAREIGVPPGVIEP